MKLLTAQRRHTSAAFLFLTLVFVIGSHAQSDVPSCVARYSATESADINERGQVLIIYSTTSWTGGIFIWDRGVYRRAFGAYDVSAEFNDVGQIIWSNVGGGGSYLWDNGVGTSLGSLRAAAINNKGQIVGSSNTEDGTRHAFLWESGEMIDLGTLGGSSSHAADINDAGQIVGASDTPSGDRHAFLWENGVMTDLGTLGGQNSEGRATNRAGQVAGSAQNAQSDWRFFLWDQGVMTDQGPRAGYSLFLWDDGRISVLEEGDHMNNLGMVAGDSWNGGSRCWALSYPPGFEITIEITSMDLTPEGVLTMGFSPCYYTDASQYFLEASPAPYGPWTLVRDAELVRLDRTSYSLHVAPDPGRIAEFYRVREGIDRDGDRVPDDLDGCPRDPWKVDPGCTGCGVAEGLYRDTDGDGVPDCADACSGHDDGLDADSDGLPDGCDPEPEVPMGMVVIPAGEFQMGDSFNGEGNSDELPVHTVYVSEFYMDPYEVTEVFWNEVWAWAVDHGYSIGRQLEGGVTNVPMRPVSWHMAVKWCNARSEKEGLTPCYYSSAAQTTVYRSGEMNLANDWVKWDANGYRLPTEAEWEKAARGGLVGKRFPWGDTISHSQANYYSSPSYSYDVSSTRGCHPDYRHGADLGYPSPVGSFAPNGYGLYDMAGNVFEWCWDWLDEAWYARGEAESADCHGPASGSKRVLRGGGCKDTAQVVRCVARRGSEPTSGFTYRGFRCVRGAHCGIDTDGDAVPDCNDGCPDNPFLLEPGECGCHAADLDMDGDGAPDCRSDLWIDEGFWPVSDPTNPDLSGLSAGSEAAHQAQIDYARSRVLPVEVQNRMGMRFRLVPPGSFLMGSDQPWASPDELPVHLVTLEYPIWVSLYEVRQSEWESVMDENPSHFGPDPTLPVDGISWEDARGFVSRLTESQGDGYRLLTEAEWEYACRAGTQTDFYAGAITGTQAGEPDPVMDRIGWYRENSSSRSHPVGGKWPNAFGLYDLNGNIWEWVEDDYHESYEGAPADGSPWVEAAERASLRCMRGGAWSFPARGSRSADRAGMASTFWYMNSGLRVARPVLEASQGGSERIPAGSFPMGDPFGEGAPDEVPVHAVSVGGFWIDRREVTKALWDEVRDWAVAHGYAFDDPGAGKESDHPVQLVNWYDAVKWCNARSEKQGLDPCYYTSTAQTTVYRTGRSDLSRDWVKWVANGYRLPTEAEWEKAARGGLVAERFPWGETISHSQANYRSSNDYSYDVSPTRGYHPDCDGGGSPYTAAAGSFESNNYGLHDMAGNVWEWCWDRYDSEWYGRAEASALDPRGPASGSERVVRGGGWVSYAEGARCANRNSREPSSNNNYDGFRCVRGLP